MFGRKPRETTINVYVSSSDVTPREVLEAHIAEALKSFERRRPSSG